MLSGLRRWLRDPSSPIRTTNRLLLEELEGRDLPSTLLGNQIFPLDNPWNQKINNAPVSAMSATWLASLGTNNMLHPDFGSGLYAGVSMGIPYNVVSGSQPKLRVVVDAYPDESDLQPVPIPDNPLLEGTPSTSGDRHMLVYDKDNNILYELYHARSPAQTGDGLWHADSESVWNLNQNYFRTPGYTSADAAGLPILPGLIRADEVFDQGVINHAIRFTAPYTTEAYIYPASHHAGRDDPSYPPMGARFRLRQDFDISTFSKPNQIILQALKDYGMILADNGASWYIGGESSPRWNNDDLHYLVYALGKDFDAVDLKPVVSSLNVTSGAPGTTVTVSGLNFSGAAGLSQVYFGALPATSFTINADNSITAVAPAGTAGTTVAVTIHSPYGISALSAADQFTYQAAPDPQSPPPPPPQSPPPPPQSPPPPPVQANPGELDFSSSIYSTAENAGTVSLTVRRLFGTDGQVTVPFTVAVRSGAGTQTIMNRGGFITFADGQDAQDISLGLQDDNLVNGDRTFTVALGQPDNGATVGQMNSAILTVVDDEKRNAGTIQFSAIRYYVSEGALMADVQVTRTGGSYGRVSVQYATQNGTARSGADYKATSGTLIFNHGETSKNLQIPIVGDQIVEGDETVRFYLTRTGGGAVLGSRKAALVVIVDDDTATLAAASASVGSTGIDPGLLNTYEVYWPWKNRK